MIYRLQSLFAGLLALLTAALLAHGAAQAKPVSGGYQNFEPAALEHQHAIQLASLGNFDHHAKVASECCNAPNRVPGGGLRVHENAGGHLIDRANGVGGQRAPSGGASSYSSIADAERHTAQVISARQSDIDAYLANPGNRRTAPFDLDIGQPTGQWVPKGGTSSQSVTGARVVITPDPSLPTGYRIITGHPIPQVVN